MLTTLELNKNQEDGIHRYPAELIYLLSTKYFAETMKRI